MATFVLVHGATVGGWAWKHVVPLLRAAGHVVFTPTLTGLGERAPLLSPEVDLTTHVEDVLGVLTYEDLHEVVLAGWSYGGTVITGVAERAAARLACLVYVDACIPQDGESALDLFEGEASVRQRVYQQGATWVIRVTQQAHPWGITDEAEAQRVRWKLTPQPRRTWEQPVHLTSPAAAALPRLVGLCTEGKTGADAGPIMRGLLRCAERARATPGWRYRELPTEHAPPVSLPRGLAALLLEAA